MAEKRKIESEEHAEADKNSPFVPVDQGRNPPSRQNSFASLAGILILGGIIGLIASLSMDTSVEVSGSGAFGLPRRVHNLDLANSQRNYIIVSALGLVIGVGLALYGSRGNVRGDDSARNTPLETFRTKKCRFCAEVIKSEAVVCRYCGRDLQETPEELHARLEAAPDKEGYRELAEAYNKSGDSGKALEIYRKILDIAGNDKDALFWAGTLCWETQNYHDAIRYLEAYLTIDHESVPGRWYILLSYVMSGDLGNAEKILETIPKHAYQTFKEEERKLLSHVYAQMGEKTLQSGHISMSKKHLRTSLMIFWDSGVAEMLADIYAREGDTSFAQNSYRGAVNSYREAVTLIPDNNHYREKLDGVTKIIRDKRQKKAFYIGALVIIALLGAGLFTWKHLGIRELTITPSKEVAWIEIDGKKYEGGPLVLERGNHKLFVKAREGHEDRTYSIKIKGRVEEGGTSPRFIVSEDNIIMDSHLGLEWVPVDNKNRTWNDASAHVHALSFAGGGWRLPTRFEVINIYDNSMKGGANPVFNIDGNSVWTSETDGSSWVWYFDFSSSGEGTRNYNSSEYHNQVLAVRARRGAILGDLSIR